MICLEIKIEDSKMCAKFVYKQDSYNERYKSNNNICTNLKN